MVISVLASQNKTVSSLSTVHYSFRAKGEIMEGREKGNPH